MIIVQIITLILMLPLTFIGLLLFNIYFNTWFYLFLSLLFSLSSGVLFGIIFGSYFVMINVCTILLVIYGIRGRLLSKCYVESAFISPHINGKILWTRKRLQIVFLFPLKILRYLKWLPLYIDKKNMLKNNMNISAVSLIQLIMLGSKGTEVHIINDGLEIYFNIK